MQRERLLFDFEAVYNKLKTTALKINSGNNGDGTYYYLEQLDFFHDVLERTLNYMDRNRVERDENSFLSIFWTSWKLARMQRYNKRDPRMNQDLKTEYFDTLYAEDGIDKEYLLGSEQPVDLDRNKVVGILKRYETASLIFAGYNYTQGGHKQGVSNNTFKKRYLKELKRIKQEVYGGSQY